MVSGNSHSFIQTLSLFFIFLSLPSSLTFSGVHAVGAGHPGGLLLPQLMPHAPRNNPLLRRQSDVTWLSAPVKATKGGHVAPGFSRRGTGLAIRAPSCQDDGYSLCPSKIVCCPSDGLCCESGDCCNKGFRCCPIGDCCPNSSNCVTIDGVRGCCPIGKTCSLNSNTCADAGYVPCKNDTFCCKPGDVCSRGPQGQAVCEPPEDNPVSSAFTTLATIKSTQVVGGATTTSSSAGGGADPSSTKTTQPANQSSRVSTAEGSVQQQATRSTTPVVTGNSLPTTMTNQFGQNTASSTSTVGGSSGNDFDPNPSNNNNSGTRTLGDRFGTCIAGLLVTAYIFW